MNRSDLIKKIKIKNSHLTKQDVKEGIDKILECLSESLARGKRVEVRNFGTFSVRSRKARVGRNPKTGKAVNVRRKFHPYFRASKGLKANLNS